MEMAHYMLHSQNMKMSFKGEVIGCETYIINHNPICSVTNMTPCEWFYRKKPFISHFYIFGSKAWVHPFLQK